MLNWLICTHFLLCLLPKRYVSDHTGNSMKGSLGWEPQFLLHNQDIFLWTTWWKRETFENMSQKGDIWLYLPNSVSWGTRLNIPTLWLWGGEIWLLLASGQKICVLISKKPNHISSMSLPLPVEQEGHLFPSVQLVVAPTFLDHWVIVWKAVVLMDFLDSQEIP